MLNGRFDKSRLPMTFYAHTLQFTDRDASDGRCAVIFEGVEKESLQMFVTGKMPNRISYWAQQTENFSALWDDFQKGGIDSPAFLEKKAGYLGKVGNAQIVLLFHSFVKAKSISGAKQDWWEITIKDGKVSKEEDACIFKITGYEKTEEEFNFGIRSVSKEEEERLYHLYTQFPKIKSDKSKDNMNSIGPNTIYGSVEVCYVGAGLCCKLIERVQGNILAFPRTVGYFDMGMENIFAERILNRNNPNHQILNNNKIRIYNEVLIKANIVQNLGIIISHWHTDHTDILNDLAVDYVRNGNYANFWQTAQFCFPEVIQQTSWCVTHYMNVWAALQQAGNNNVIEEPYNNADQIVNIYQSPGMEINKCDRNDGHLRNINHHDHGIWAVVTLNSGNTVFLAGDCAYDTIGVRNVNSAELTNNGNGFDYLVASHHGGKYTHTNARTKAQYIPTPSQAQQSIVIYSANGVAYNHPAPNKVNDYVGIGWVPRYMHIMAVWNTLRFTIR